MKNPIKAGISLPDAVDFSSKKAPSVIGLGGDIRFPEKTNAAELSPIARGIEGYISDFAPVYFSFNDSCILGWEMGGLKKIRFFLEENIHARLLLRGYCDERGSVEYNLRLGSRRAESIRGWLVAAGVDENRIDIVSFGDSELLVFDCGDNESCHAKNRRVEFEVIR